MAVQISGNDITVPRDGSFTRNVTIGGTLTYEDVTNIDSVGLVTARNGIEIGARPGVAASISVDGNMIVSGISTFGGDVQVPDKIIHSGDTNTALRFPAVDTFTVETAGSERIRINDNGKVLIATDTTSEAHANQDELIIGKTTDDANHGLTIVTPDDRYGTVAFSDGSGGNSQGLLEYNHSGDYMRIYTAASERLRIDSSGRLLLGTTSTSGVSGSSDDIIIGSIGDSTDRGITFATTGIGAIRWADAGDNAMGRISYSNASDFMFFSTSNAEAMRILSNQSICMGGTLQAGANGGVNIESTSSGNKPVGLSLINQGTADDSGFTVSYRGKDAAGNQEDFAYLKFTAQDTTNGAEDGNLEIWTVSSGSLTKKMQIGPGKANGEPTAFVFMDSNASGASSEECLRLSNISDTAYNWCTVSFAVNNSVQWKVGAQRHGAGGGADLLFINNGNDRFRIYESGKLRSQQTYSGTTTGGGPIYVESDGDFLRYTSSRKYKTDIETLEDARADKILDCRPVWYRSLSENDIKTPGADKSDWGWYGFIAEEVAEIEPRLVNWATKDAGSNPDDGFASVERDPSNYTAEGVRYDNFVPLLVNLVKRQKAEIESLKARLDAAGL